MELKKLANHFWISLDLLQKFHSLQHTNGDEIIITRIVRYFRKIKIEISCLWEPGHSDTVIEEPSFLRK